MKTPFDGAIRVGRREIDEMRIAISVEIDQLVQIETARLDNERETSRQREVAGDDVLLSSHAYLARMRVDRARLQADQAVVDHRLAQLRAKAVTAYGTLKGVSAAADTWRVEAEQAIATAEQEHLDDLANALFVRDRQLARKGRA
jgi:hypothetical protein